MAEEVRLGLLYIPTGFPTLEEALIRQAQHLATQYMMPRNLAPPPVYSDEDLWNLANRLTAEGLQPFTLPPYQPLRITIGEYVGWR